MKLHQSIQFFWYSRVSHVRNPFYLAYCFRTKVYCSLKNLVSQFLIKWFLICKTLLYSFITLNNLCSVNCTWSERKGISWVHFGGVGARDNILSTLGSVQYFRGYHHGYIGGFHYLGVILSIRSATWIMLSLWCTQTWYLPTFIRYPSDVLNNPSMKSRHWSEITPVTCGIATP